MFFNNKQNTVIKKSYGRRTFFATLAITIFFFLLVVFLLSYFPSAKDITPLEEVFESSFHDTSDIIMPEEEVMETDSLVLGNTYTWAEENGLWYAVNGLGKKVLEQGFSQPGSIFENSSG
ncbi:MAG: hypothetical protein FWG61_03105 [Firmicutes bacterium]|nr:hypothetical protein [Bacillota bacterium]